jgi:RNA polymerase sigma factor (sigma-70 family)
MEFFVTTGPQQTAGQAMVVEAMSGDREAMDALWHEHRRWIAAVLLAHKSPEDQVEDLLQEVAMTIVAKINTLREARYVRAWLRTVAINAARASARARRARPKLTPMGVEPLGPDASGLAVDDEARRLMKLSERLADTYREPLMLRALHGMRGRHIAEILDLSEATVETRIARARRMLRELATGTAADDDERAPVGCGDGHGRTS